MMFSHVCNLIRNCRKGDFSGCLKADFRIGPLDLLMVNWNYNGDFMARLVSVD